MSRAGWKKISNSTLYKVESTSPEETEAIGREIAHLLPDKGVVCLKGDLGAGKTTLSKGIVSELTGLSPHEVNSPTFTYLNIYEGEDSPLFHIDCYRLKGEKEFLERGLDEYFEGRCLIEWPERILKILPACWGEITIEYNGERGRVIQYEENSV